MTTADILALTAGSALAVAGLAVLFPRKRKKAGPENNWQQRDGSEMFSADNIESTIGSTDVAMGIVSESAAFGGAN